MPVQSQTIDRRAQVNVEVGGLDWFHRLCQRFIGFFQPAAGQDSFSQYGTWDAERERFHQIKADSAADLIAAQRHWSWSSRIYGASL